MKDGFPAGAEPTEGFAMNGWLPSAAWVFGTPLEKVYKTRSSWDERTPPTTVLPSGLRLTGVEQWVKSLQAIAGEPSVVKVTIRG